MQGTKFLFGPLYCSPHSISELLEDIRYLLTDRAARPRTINCVNAHIFNLAWENPALADALNCSRVVAADGMSIVWVSRLLQVPVRDRCNMTEAFRAFIADETFPPTRAILIGGTQEEADVAGEKINGTSSHLSVIDALSGYWQPEEYLSYFQSASEVDFVLLGLGTPKTENLSRVISEIHKGTIIWHIGGGTILFLSNRLQEAPKWMRRSGLQWVHRLILEPERMWRRYLLGNLLFLSRIAPWVIKLRLKTLFHQ